MRETVLWQRLDRSSIEFSQWEWDRAVVFGGEVVGDLNGALGRVKYQVRVGEDQFTRGARIHLWSNRGHHQLHLFRSYTGEWQANGRARPDLTDATDVDIGVTPATNTLPLRRFRLAVGESRDLVAAWVRFPTLSVVPAYQRYTRIATNRYLYESLESGYRAELTVQNDGIVVQYADIWRMLT